MLPLPEVLPRTDSSPPRHGNPDGVGTGHGPWGFLDSAEGAVLLSAIFKMGKGLLDPASPREVVPLVTDRDGARSDPDHA